jgi:hypothetical protein
MNRAKGYIQFIDPLYTEEYETFTCAHCNSIVRMQKDVSLQSLDMAIRMGKEKRDIRRCHSCDMLICPKCISAPTCVPFEKKLREYEQRERLRVAVG